MDCSTPGFPVLHHLPEFTQAHVHWVGDAIQPSHPLSSPSPPAFNPSQHQGLFQWVIRWPKYCCFSTLKNRVQYSSWHTGLALGKQARGVMTGLLSGCGGWPSHCGGFSCCQAQAPESAGSVIVAHGLELPTACGIFPDQGANLCPLHWQADS